ncbi:putative colanic acid biosynthesis acetyltransferase WcaF [Herbaspirillum sp. SJZ130]|nr:putative colanic acid biosynthesis acetyltransferase WcaF [Herbaspirillum sp. SJZ130]TQK09733.1 putative colanic acid biosynthesis acetyltransferase WcaF [Herbaspirillum sp. SJZ106]TWC65917.1 putative colanic acid biosynthesis acetyltransferase WcaF [Herbaspirillum sp. SJZ099]
MMADGFFSANQRSKIAAALFNLAFNCLPGFGLRRGFLRMLGFRIGEKVSIHSWVTFFEARRNVRIGSNVTINGGCYLDNRLGIDIGNNVNISHDVKIYTLGHDIDDPQCAAVGGKVTIHDDAWIFPNVLIMPKVVIGRGAVVYPGSVVTRDVGELEVVGGNPARKIRMRRDDIQYRIDYPVWFAK